MPPQKRRLAARASDDEADIVTVTGKSFYGAKPPPRPRLRASTTSKSESSKSESSKEQHGFSKRVNKSISAAAKKTPTKSKRAPVASGSQSTPPTRRSSTRAAAVPVTITPGGPTRKRAKIDYAVEVPVASSSRSRAVSVAPSAADASDDEHDEMSDAPSEPRKERKRRKSIVGSMRPRTPVSRSKKRAREPSPSPAPAPGPFKLVSVDSWDTTDMAGHSSDEEADVEDEVAANLVVSPTPSSSTLPITPTKRRPSLPPSPPPSHQHHDDPAELSEDELTMLPTTPKVATPAPKVVTPTPKEVVTPSSWEPKIVPQESDRARGLPSGKTVGAPKNLASHFLSDSDGDDSDDESDDDRARASDPTPSTSPLKGKGKGKATTAAKGKGKEVVRTGATYPTPLVQSLLGSIGSVLAGHRYPDASTPAGSKKFKQKDVMAHPYLEGYEEWERPMRYAMESVVRDGTGNCLVVLGPRGVGKTMIVEKSLALLAKVRGPDSFITIRLNGLIHTTDRQALRAIARQLKSSGYTEDDGDWGSNAATMATLLRMLEPPTSGDSQDRSADRPVIIVVDEFDLFALHPRQSFLYCLLDIVQGNRRKSGMGVIGLSSRTDCLSILEKRVRSRCQSQVYQMVLPNSFSEYLQRTESLLRANAVGDTDEANELADEWNDEVKAFLADIEVRRYFEDLWRTHGSTPTHLLKALASMYYTLEWNTRHSSTDWASLAPSRIAIPRLDVGLLPPLSRYRDDLMSQLTVLELTVCVAAKHVRNVHHESCNLEMLYDCYKEYYKRIQGISAMQIKKEAFAMALDSLRGMEVFLPITGKPQHYFAPSLADGFRMLKFVPWFETVDAELYTRVDVPEPLRRWCKHWQGPLIGGNNRHSRSVSLSLSSSAIMDAHPDLAKLSREQLVEIVGRDRKQLDDAAEKTEQLELREAALLKENDAVAKDFETAKAKIDDLLHEEGRMEEELAGRIEVLDKLRSSVRELEREKRDADKRYRDQGDSFDSERQSWYDQEQHYKLRIANLSNTNRKGRLVETPKPTTDSTAEYSDSEASEAPSRHSRRSQSPRGASPSPSPSSAPSSNTNEVALQEQLASLTTAHSSLTSTMRTLQVELSELKRVYQDLQEENESYEILLGEKTLNGEVQDTDLFRRSSAWMDERMSPRMLDAVGEESDEDSEEESEEEEEEEAEMDVEAVLLETQGIGSSNAGAVAAGAPSGKRKRPAPKTSGGGLDLAAELEAAQLVQEDEPEKRKKPKKKRSPIEEEVVELRTELKHLKEANKALTLYVSKIVDRVCSQEGFEKVLAVDYRLATPKSGASPDPTTKPGYNPAQPPATTFRNSSYTLSPRDSVSANGTTATAANPTAAAGERSAGGRRILGWETLSSVFSGSGSTKGEKNAAPLVSPSANPGLKPFVLGFDPNAPRKLETEEDDDDIRERERLRAEMALHGLQDSGNSQSWGSRRTSTSTPRTPDVATLSPGSPNPPVSPVDLDELYKTSPLVAEQIAAQQIKVTLEKEQVAKTELEQGRASGFTESIPRRQRPGSMRSSRSSSSRGESSVGLGISDPTGRITPEGSPSISSPATTASPEQAARHEGPTDETDASWSKRLKRISISLSRSTTSPNPNLPPPA
ncbi:hypothetical protein RQP46_003016 [Phenoliferia psychrophenolica]